MEDKPVLISKDGLRKFEEELERLLSVRRPEVAERIRAARDFGDIAENAEYTEAKNEQSLLEGRILTLESIVRNAVLIEDGRAVAVHGDRDAPLFGGYTCPKGRALPEIHANPKR